MQQQSSHYTVLARRFRPQTFEDVVGQENVARALQGAIRTGRVAHAYLFTGVRGVGKTSMARILAKALNCPNAHDAIPCNDCEICDGISAGNDVDVLEIDGASNRGIDDIRLLRSNVNVKSMRTEYKIYIIDEVHMLTKEAFNALLKTLEEPPPMVKFVFCTTEPNKLPDTILSRCQRFDFSTIATQNIIERLQQIAQAEGFEVDPGALELVARRAGGSMRDSQSLFDQLLAFGEDKITADDVHRLLGTADDERLIELVDALVTRRRGDVLGLFDRALSQGVQLGELVDQLVGYLRDLMVIASGADAVSLLSVSQVHREKLSEQSAQWGLQTIVAALEILAETKSRMFRVGFGRALAEMALIRLSLLEDLRQLDELIGELKTGSTTGRKDDSPRAANRAPESGRPAQKKTASTENEGREQPESPESFIQIIDFRAGCEQELLSQLVSHIDDTIKSHIQAVKDLAISGPNQLALSFPKCYHFSKRYCEKPEILSRIESLASKLTGRPLRIVTRLADDDSKSQPETDSSAKSSTDRSTEANDDPYVKQVMSVFGATVFKVEEMGGPSAREE